LKNLTPQQEGIEFEKRFAKKYNSNQQPRSGAGTYYKLDVRDTKFLWSLKWTGNKSYSLKTDDLKEVENEVYGPGGIGLEFVPGMAVELQNEVYAVLKMDDLVKLLEQDIKVFKTDKASEKRARAATPRLFRSDED